MLALVTGAAQGIGKAIADKLRQEGHQVIGVDRQTGVEAQLDLTDLEAIVAFIEQLPECPQILVNAAGICLTRPFFVVEQTGFAKMQAINVQAPLVLMQSVAARLVKEGKSGSFVNITSNSAFMPKLEQLDYAATKAALISVTKSAALSLGPHGIRVNAVAPGFIETDMTAALPEKARLRLCQGITMGRSGTPEDVAKAVLFLVSDLSQYITGQVLGVDGGLIL
jgi:NAD(P)-dependent dehydrogenase (short-subunit alcohol dehydrogenase family)